MMPVNLQQRQNRQADLLETQAKRLEVLILEHEMAIEKYVERLDRIGDPDDPQAILVRSQIEYLILTARGQVYQFTQQLESAREMAESIRNPIPLPNFNYGMPMPAVSGVPIVSLRCDRCRADFKVNGFQAVSADPPKLNDLALSQGWRRIGPDEIICPSCQQQERE